MVLISGGKERTMVLGQGVEGLGSGMRLLVKSTQCEYDDAISY